MTTRLTKDGRKVPGVVLFAVVVALAAIGKGRLWCNWVCPAGAIEVIPRLERKNAHGARDLEEGPLHTHFGWSVVHGMRPEVSGEGDPHRRGLSRGGQGRLHRMRRMRHAASAAALRTPFSRARPSPC
ncbi:MAG: 4Fe-4S binding protein [Kiritimatiellae bacterium]|nr:4Fe-4S binding protein [Kiritimatiellia bacterium]